MFIKITALFSIFHLIIGENSTNLMLADSVNFAGKISDDDLLKNILERLELLQAVSENIRVKMTTLGVMFNEHLAKQGKEIKEDLEELKAAALTELSKPSTPVDQQTETANGTKDEHCNSKLVFKSCAEALKNNNASRGVYSIEVAGSNLPPFYVYCLKTKSGDDTDDSYNSDDWLIIQRRQNGRIDFFRKWVDYQNGFGHLEGEFFIGLDKLHAITASKLHELWIQMEDFEGGKRWAKYSHFAIGGKDEKYALNILGSFSGVGNDSLREHAGQKFSTKDRDNDISAVNCAEKYTGAWWYRKCTHSNLNGRYLKGDYADGTDREYGQGVVWKSWRGYYYSLKYVHMAIRPLFNSDNPHCT